MAGALFQNAAAAPRGRPPAKTPETDCGWGVERLLTQALPADFRREHWYLSAARAWGIPCERCLEDGRKDRFRQARRQRCPKPDFLCYGDRQHAPAELYCFRPIVARLRNLRVWFGMSKRPWLNFSVAPTSLFPSGRFVGNGKYRAGAVLLCPFNVGQLRRGLDYGISRPHTLGTFEGRRLQRGRRVCSLPRLPNQQSRKSSETQCANRCQHTYSPREQTDNDQPDEHQQNCCHFTAGRRR